ncbi:phosphoribosyltransferase [Patescibacteria group bacterium]|nr:phosphoribosyltransferase [Patescibacteria group bacterium]
MKWFEEIGVIRHGHFVLTSGKHSDLYVNKDGAYPYVVQISMMCKIIAEHFPNWSIEVVAAPALGGIALGQWVAYHLAERSIVAIRAPFSVYAEKSNDGQTFEFRRGYNTLISGKRVLVVEDILTTGGSVAKVIAAVHKLGGVVVGVGALCNRGGVTAEALGVPKLYSVTSLSADAWEEADCPLCSGDVPIDTDVGKGREYLAHKMAEGEWRPG